MLVWFVARSREVECGFVAIISQAILILATFVNLSAPEGIKSLKVSNLPAVQSMELVEQLRGPDFASSSGLLQAPLKVTSEACKSAWASNQHYGFYVQEVPALGNRNINIHWYINWMTHYVGISSGRFVYPKWKWSLKSPPLMGRAK